MKQSINKKLIELTLILFAFLVFGCAMFKKTVVLKQYKIAESLDCKKDSLNGLCKPYIAIDLFSSTEIEEKDSEKMLWNLGGEGQAALINKLSERYKDNNAFKKELDNKYLKQPENTDYTTKKVKIILTVDKLTDLNPQSKSFSLADRIQYLHLNLSFNNPKVSFKKWNKFETEFAEIELGDVSFEKSFESTFDIGNDATIGKVEAKGGLTKSESLKLKNRIATLNGKFSKDSLVLNETGALGIDLNGNVIIEATIQFKDTTAYFAEFSNLRNSKGEYLPVDSVDLDMRKIRIPNIPDDQSLTANLKYDYTFRHVTKNAATFPEYDDDVILIDSKGEKDSISILDLDEIKPDRYLIFGDKQLEDYIGLEYYDDNTKSSNKHQIELWFSAEEKAIEFYTWLRYWGKQKPFDTTQFRFNTTSDRVIWLSWIINRKTKEQQAFTYRTAHIWDFAEIRKL